MAILREVPSDERFLTAQWRHLAMVNYEVDPAVLAPRVPDGTELDLWQDRALVSVVGFLFLDTRLGGWRIPFHVNFEEVNLRFYVRRRYAGRWRRGVVFVQEIVPRRAIAAVARRAYGENYIALPMSHEVAEDGSSAAYRWRFEGRDYAVAVEAGREAALPADGSEEEFITEHYWGYGRLADGDTAEYQVSHPRWLVRQAFGASFRGDGGRLYGESFGEALAAEPSSAFLAEGSRIAVHQPSRLPRSRPPR